MLIRSNILRHLTSAMIVLTSLCASLPIWGQRIPTSDLHRFNLAILSAIDEYERSSSLIEDEDARVFLGLFENQDSCVVYNDILGTPHFQEMISPYDYVQSIRSNDNVILRTEMKDVQKQEDAYYKDGRLHRKIGFSKYVLTIDASVYSEGEGGVFFDSTQYFDDAPDFSILVDFAFDSQNGNCFIAGIEAAEQKEHSPLDEDQFTVIVGSEDKFEKYDKKLVTGSNPVEFNEYNQTVAYYNDVDVDSQDVYAETIEVASGDNYNVVKIKYHPMYFRMKLYGNLASGSAYKVKSMDNGVVSTSDAMEFGLDLGFEKSVGSKWRMGLYTGIAFSKSSFEMEYKGINYSIKTHLFQTREYSFDAKEKASISDITIPVYWENEFDLSKRLVLDLDLGIKTYLSNSTYFEPLFIDGTINGEPYHEQISTFNDKKVIEYYDRDMVDFSLFGRCELDLCLVKRLLYLYASYSYEYGLKPIYSSDKVFFSGPNKIYPIQYSYLLRKDVAVRPIMSSMSFQRNASWLSAGLKFKF